VHTHTHTNTIFSLVFFYPRARIHYLFFDGALFTFLLAQLGNFSCYIKVLSQMVSPTPTSTASSSVAPPPGSAALFYGCSAPLISASCSLFKKKTCNFSPSVIYLRNSPHSLTHSFSIRLSYLTPWERQAQYAAFYFHSTPFQMNPCQFSIT
jgi:hypothetical protein